MASARRDPLLLLFLLSSLLGWAGAPEAAAQLPWRQVFAGSEEEHYLRTLQISGAASTYPWAIRAFSETEIALMNADSLGHPWAARFRFSDGDFTDSPVQVLPLTLGANLNSSFPNGENDGAVWAGRGLTVSTSGGVSAGTALGPAVLSATLAPIAFWAQNADFDLAVNPETDVPLRDAFFSSSLDRPQRFGDDPYGRLDWGQSTLRGEAWGLTAGISAANQIWGPARRYPLVLGTNAPGFPHVFLGTARPRTSLAGAVHARLLWGELEQSSYAPPNDHPRRLMTGWVLSYTPPILRGLELGASRFYHLAWPAEGEWGRSLRRPLEGFLANSRERADEEPDDNQLISVFLRWTLPSSGLEVYGEYAREDYSYRLRDLLLEPDHTSGYTLGFARVWRPSERRWWVLRAEVLNAARTQNVRVRFYGPFYVHHVFRQGHTHRGQLLGSPAALGGGGLNLALDEYDADGRWTATLSRTVQYDPLSSAESTSYPGRRDVLYEAGVERLLFRGPLELSLRVGGGYNLDRYLTHDEVNASLALSARYVPDLSARR